MLTNLRQHIRSLLRYGALPLGIASLVVVLRSFFFTPYRIQTAAMAPELKPGQWALFARHASPERGDLILFASPLGGLAVARVIALPGDSLEQWRGQVFVHGEPETYFYPKEPDYQLRIPREQGVYPLSRTNLVAYRLALRTEVGYRTDSSSPLQPTEQERLFWRSYLKEHPYHTFRQDYYWVLTNQPQQGADSRSFGLLPAEAIRGVLMLNF